MSRNAKEKSAKTNTFDQGSRGGNAVATKKTIVGCSHRRYGESLYARSVLLLMSGLILLARQETQMIDLLQDL